MDVLAEDDQPEDTGLLDGLVQTFVKTRVTVADYRTRNAYTA
jgi:hypothetical protein